ncbi:MAG TPA: hypothetical protein VGA50_21455 [Kiloniellales bacterium]
MRPIAYGVTTEDEAHAAVRELAAANVDMVKIWVDDRRGTVEKLTPELYGAVIDEAHRHDLRVAAHIFALADAKGLLRAGLDGFAHGVRDMDVDDELMALLAERPETFLIPNLPDSGQRRSSDPPLATGTQRCCGDTVSVKVARIAVQSKSERR